MEPSREAWRTPQRFGFKADSTETPSRVQKQTVLFLNDQFTSTEQRDKISTRQETILMQTGEERELRCWKRTAERLRLNSKVLKGIVKALVLLTLLIIFSLNYLIILSMKCQIKVKNAHHHFQKPKSTHLKVVLFSLKPPNIQFIIIYEIQRHQIVTFEKQQ